jgi:uncharacterized membrane protein
MKVGGQYKYKMEANKKFLQSVGHFNLSNRKVLEIAGIFVMIILASELVASFAVSSAYWEENPLVLPAGETKDIKLILQNLASPDEINLKASIDRGSEVIGLADPSDIYLVPGGEKKDVNLRVAIPIDAKVGDIYPVRMVFTTVAPGAAGGFVFGSSIEKSFNVVVGAAPGTITPSYTLKEKSLTWILVIVIIIVAAVIIWRLLKRKKQEKSFNKS